MINRAEAHDTDFGGTALNNQAASACKNEPKVLSLL